jgi:hypothetical protein
LGRISDHGRMARDPRTGCAPGGVAAFATSVFFSLRSEISGQERPISSRRATTSAARRDQSPFEKATHHAAPRGGSGRLPPMSPGCSEELPGRHHTVGFATAGIASDTLSRAAQRARHGAFGVVPRASHRLLVNRTTTSTPRASATSESRHWPAAPLPSDKGRVLSAPALASRFIPLEG